MKKILFILVLILPTSVNAGFIGGVLEGLTANALSGAGAAYISENKKRMAQVNSFLWHQHKTNSYDESTAFYVKWQEMQIEASGYDDINLWDTLAWVYKDNGDKKRAIEIYKTRIMPWVKIYFKNDKNVKRSKTNHQYFREKWQASFKKIQE